MKNEITDIIYKKIGGEKVGIRWTEAQECSNEVVKLFRNRIDELLNEMKTFDGCHSNGYREGLECVKLWLV